MLYIRFPLSLRNVEDLLHERGIDVSHETVRHWWGPRTVVTDGLRSYRAAMTDLGVAGRQRTGRWLKNRAEKSPAEFKLNRAAALAEWRQLGTP